MNSGTSTSYRKAPGETTEWHDILVKKGVIEKTEEEKNEEAKDLIAAAAEEVRERVAARHPLESKTLEELREVEDDYADSHEMDSFRAKRVAELKALAARNRFGTLLPLSRDEFVREVTEASKGPEGADGEGVAVVVYLYKDGIPDSALLMPIMRQLAAKHAYTKFNAIVADQCIENYPDRNVPTLFVYRRGEVTNSFVGLAPLGGQRTTVDRVEWALSRVGVLTTELDEDPAKTEARGGSLFARGGAGSGRRRRGSDRSDSEDDDR